MLKERESHALQCLQPRGPCAVSGPLSLPDLSLHDLPLIIEQPAALPCPQAGIPSCPIPASPIPTCSGAGLEPKPAETEVQTHPSLTIPAEEHVMDALILLASHSHHAGMGLGWSRGHTAQCSRAAQYLQLFGSFAHCITGDSSVLGVFLPMSCSAEGGEGVQKRASVTGGRAVSATSQPGQAPVWLHEPTDTWWLW